MKTYVYTQYVGGSGLDARYVGTVNEPPEIVADHLRTVRSVQTVEVYGDEVIAFGPK